MERIIAVEVALEPGEERLGLVVFLVGEVDLVALDVEVVAGVLELETAAAVVQRFSSMSSVTVAMRSLRESRVISTGNSYSIPASSRRMNRVAIMAAGLSR